MAARLKQVQVEALGEETQGARRATGVSRATLISTPRSLIFIDTFRRGEFVSAKRGPLDSRHVEGILQGCTNMGFGACRLSRFHPHYVVIEP